MISHIQYVPSALISVDAFPTVSNILTKLSAHPVFIDDVDKYLDGLIRSAGHSRAVGPWKPSLRIPDLSPVTKHYSISTPPCSQSPRTYPDTLTAIPAFPDLAVSLPPRRAAFPACEGRSGLLSSAGASHTVCEEGKHRRMNFRRRAAARVSRARSRSTSSDGTVSKMLSAVPPSVVVPAGQPFFGDGDNFGTNIDVRDKHNVPLSGDVMSYKKDTTLAQAKKMLRKLRKTRQVRRAPATAPILASISMS